MRLLDLVGIVKRKVSEGTNFFKNPVAMMRQRGARGVLKGVRDVTIPIPGQQQQREQVEQGNSEQINNSSTREVSRPVNESHQRISQPHRQPAMVAAGTQNGLPNRSRYTTLSSAVSDAPQRSAYSQTEEFFFTDDEPLFSGPQYPQRLPPGKELQGEWEGGYKIVECREDREWIRRYEGIHENNSELVWIYEYCLSKDILGRGLLEKSNLAQRQRRFRELIYQNLRLGDGSDFRILKPIDISVGEKKPCCYVVTKALKKEPSLEDGQLLADYLAKFRAPASAYQIRMFFKQLLQTLQYLQTYRVNWPDDGENTSEIGLPHGALSTESLWLRFSALPMASGELPFFVYVSRFALWEKLFCQQTIAQSSRDLGSLTEDFKALANVGFAWITGNPEPGDPTDRSLWPQDDQVLAFYPFVCQLLGKGGNFRGVDVAIAALTNLPEKYVPDEPLPEPAVVTSQQTQPGFIWLGLGLALLGLGSIAFLQWDKGTIISPTRSKCEQQQTCLLKNIEGLKVKQKIHYGWEPGSAWSTSFFRTLRSPFEYKTDSEPLLEQVLEKRDESFELERMQQIDSRDSLFTQLTDPSLKNKDALNVGFIRTQQDVPEKISTEVVAYDGIAVFVAYSDSQRDQGIPRLLNGKISLEKLQKLFSGQENQLQGRTVKLYRPDDDQVFEIFHDFLFEKYISQDREIEDIVQTGNTKENMSRISTLSSDIKADILSDFETPSDNEPSISIGFDRISQVVGQCSVYPLAITHQGTFSILIDANGNPIDINTDLCGDKGSYWVDSKIFNRTNILNEAVIDYPFGYEMAIAYPACNEDGDTAGCEPGKILAQKLLTLEGQYLLSETGLVPKTPISEIRQHLWK